MADVSKLVEKGKKFLNSGKVESAIEAYREVAKLDPENEETLATLGDLYLKVHRGVEGAQCFTRLVAAQIKREDPSSAAQTLRKLLQINPKDTTNLMKLAGLLEQSGRPKEAVEAYRQAAPLLKAAKRTSQVFDCYRKIVALDPTDLEENVQLGEIAVEQKQTSEAAEAFFRAAGLAKSAGDEARSLKLMEQGRQLDPNSETGTLAIAEAYFKREQFQEVTVLLKPLLAEKGDSPELLGLLARTYIESGQFEEAEPLARKLYKLRPETATLMTRLVGAYTRLKHSEKANNLLREMKESFLAEGNRTEYAKMLEEVYAADTDNFGLLDQLADIYDETSQDEKYNSALTRLFDRHTKTDHYKEAGNILERMIELDPYAAGLRERVQVLEGKIDKVWYDSIDTRLSQTMGSPASGGGSGGGKTLGGSMDMLDDLLIEAEIFQQYGLTDKVRAQLEKINKIFPGAEEENSRLKELYESVGMEPAKPKPVKVSSATAPGASAAESMDGLRTVTAMSAVIFRESSQKGVLGKSVEEVGGWLKSSRCWGALGGEDGAPSITAEYCSPSTQTSNPNAARKIFSTLMQQAPSKPDGWVVDDVSQSPALKPVQRELDVLGIRSMLAMPLLEEDKTLGLILVQECGSHRTWSANEALLLKTLGTQIAVALNATKLRRLVRSLAGTDSNTGFLPRSAYLECLLAEAERAKTNDLPVSLTLLELDNGADIHKTLGDKGLQDLMAEMGQCILGSVRQNDIAIRYNPYAVAIILPDTPVNQATKVLEKLGKVLTQLRASGNPITYCGAVGEMVLNDQFNSADGVTELINRIHDAVIQAQQNGGNRILLSRFSA